MKKFLELIKNLFCTWTEYDTPNNIVYVKTLFYKGEKYFFSYYYCLPSLTRYRAIGIMIYKEYQGYLRAYWRDLNVPMSPADAFSVGKQFLEREFEDKEGIAEFPLQEGMASVTHEFINSRTEKHIEAMFYSPAKNEGANTQRNKNKKDKISPKKSPVKKSVPSKKTTPKAKKNRKPRK